MTTDTQKLETLSLNEPPKRVCPTCKATYNTRIRCCPADGDTLELRGGDPLLGATIGGRYVLEERLGSGAMAVVYRASHLTLGDNVQCAVKVLHGDRAADEEMRRRFEQEAQSASTLRHPNVVSILDFGRDPTGLLYIAMELVEGRTLAEIIENEAPLDADRVVRLSRGLCEGLHHAHENNLIHRDFKPDNVMVVVDENGEEVPKIVDFGLAISGNKMSPRMTAAGTIVGTPLYLSPEQAFDLDVDHRADLFSLGVVLYEMLTGKPTFDGTAMQILHLNATKRPPPLATRCPGISVEPALERVVFRLIEHKPEGRFSTAEAVIEELSHPEPTVDFDAVPPAPFGAETLVLSGLEIPRVNAESAIELVELGVETRPKQSWVRRHAAAVAGVVGASVAAMALLAVNAGWLTESATRSMPTLATAAALSSDAADESPIAPKNERKTGDDVPTDDGELTSDDELVIEDEPAIDSGRSQASTSTVSSRVSNPREASRPTKKKSPARNTRSVDEPTQSVRREPGGSPEEADRPSRKQRSSQPMVPSDPPTRTESASPIVAGESSVTSAQGSGDSAKREEVGQAAPTKPALTSVDALPTPTPPPKTTTTTPTTPTTKPKQGFERSRAVASVSALSVKGSLTKTVVNRALGRARRTFGACYRKHGPTRAKPSRAQVSLTLGERGFARNIKVSYGTSSSVTQCLRKSLGKVRSRIAPDVGTVSVTFRVVFDDR